MKDFLMTLVFPHKCAACGKTMPGKRTEMLCETCDRQLHAITEPRCKRCSKPVDDLTQAVLKLEIFLQSAWRRHLVIGFKGKNWK